ncbi:hypothetical protein ES703_14485 [subsurface metagenome]
MGLIYADIKLINALDMALFRKKKIPENGVKKIQVKTLVDCGAYMMSIPEHIKVQLDLDIVDYREAELTNGKVEKLPVAGPIEIVFKNRRAVINAFVTGNEVLLGAIPMEELDVIIDPKKQTLDVNPENPNMPKMKLEVQINSAY